MSALPDVPAPESVAPQRSSTGTVVIERSPPVSGEPVTPRQSTGTVAIRGPTGTLALAPRVGPTGTVALKDAPPPAKPLDPSESMTIDFSVGTVWEQLHPTTPTARSPVTTASAVAPDASTSPAPPPAAQPLSQPSRSGNFLRMGGLAMAALLLVTVAIGALVRHEGGPSMDPGAPPVATAPVVTAAEPAAPSPEPTTAPSSDAVAPPAAPATAAVPATTTGNARGDLSGTWSGAYLDASGKALLRVVSLSINRVDDDGGVEGSLQYEAASGDGECKLHPRGSIWSARDHRLQLSPESCSPHYPRELGVPLDFAGVNPRGNILKDGRIEAPTGEVIKVRLKRVSGV